MNAARGNTMILDVALLKIKAIDCGKLGCASARIEHDEPVTAKRV